MEAITERAADLLRAVPPTPLDQLNSHSVAAISKSLITTLTNLNGRVKRACLLCQDGQRIDQMAFKEMLRLAHALHLGMLVLLEHNAQPADQAPAEEHIIKEEKPQKDARRQPREAPASSAAPAPTAAPVEEPEAAAAQIAFAAYTPDPVPEKPVEQPVAPTEEPITDLPVLAIAGGADERGEPAQRGVFGIRFTKPYGYLAHNLDEPTALAAFGSPGAGKSYFIYGKFESHLRRVPGINSDLAQAACGIIPRIGAGPDIPLEFLASVFPNRRGVELDALRVFYQVEAAGVPDQAIWCLPEDVVAYRKRYPYAMVEPLCFDLKQLTVGSITRVMGAHGSKQPLYMRELVRGLRELKVEGEATLGKLRDVVRRMKVPDGIRKLASARLDLIEPFVREGVDPRAVLVRPGRAITVAISADTVTPEEGMLLGTLALDTLALRTDNADCPLVILFDECHEHFASPEMTSLIVHLTKRRRHIGCSSLFATHDPRCFKDGIIGILDGVAQFPTDDKEALKVLAKELSIFEHLKPEDVAVMEQGHGWFWARSFYNDPEMEPAERLGGDQLYHVLVRPRFAHHGGATKKAVKK